MQNLGGMSFTVQANTKDATSALKVYKESAEKMYKEVTGYALAATKAEIEANQRLKEMSAQVAAAVERTRTQTNIRRMLEEDAAEAAAKTAVAATKASTAVAAAGRSGFGAGMGFLFLSQAIEDSQYGFSAIVNNIPMMVMAFGGSAGLAGGVSIAAVAVNQLINHWGQLTDALKATWAGEAIGQLTAIREKAEEAAKAFEKLSKVPTEAQATQNRGVASAVTEAGADALAQAVAIRIGQDPRLRAHAKDLPISFSDVVGVTKPNVPQMLGEANLKKARELIAGATGGDANSLLELRKLAPEIADKIDNASPAGQERLKQQRLEAEGARNNRKMEEKLIAEKLAEQQQQTKWEAEGRKNERDWEKKQERKAEQAENERLRAATQALFRKPHDMPRIDKIDLKASQYVGLADFAKNIQMGAFGNGQDKQLAVLHEQVEILKQIKTVLDADGPQFNLGSPAALAVGPN